MMEGVLLRVLQDSYGRLYLRSDLPEGLSREEKQRIISDLTASMAAALCGNKERAVTGAIRQLALGSMMCEGDLRQAEEDFRAEADMFIVTGPGAGTAKKG